MPLSPLSTLGAAPGATSPTSTARSPDPPPFDYPEKLTAEQSLALFLPLRRDYRGLAIDTAGLSSRERSRLVRQRLTTYSDVLALALGTGVADAKVALRGAATTLTDRPAALPLPLPGALPPEMRRVGHRAACKLFSRDGRMTKVPIDVRTGRGATPNGPDTWGTFDGGYANAKRHG